MMSFVIALMMSLFGTVSSSGADIDLPVNHNAVSHSQAFVVPETV